MARHVEMTAQAVVDVNHQILRNMAIRSFIAC